LQSILSAERAYLVTGLELRISEERNWWEWVEAISTLQLVTSFPCNFLTCKRSKSLGSASTGKRSDINCQERTQRRIKDAFKLTTARRQTGGILGHKPVFR